MTYNPVDHPFVAMPLGGIGTGSLAIGSDGGFRQVQLHNVGNHRGDLPGTFLALRVMQHEPAFDRTVVLQQAREDPGSIGHPATPMVDDDLVPPWQRELLARVGGTRTTMEAIHPIAEVVHEVDAPLEVRVRACSPWSTGDLDASGIPAVMLEVELTNPSDAIVRTWLAHSGHNAIGLDPHINPRGTRAHGYGGNTNQVRRGPDGSVRLVMENPSVDPTSPSAGQMVLGVQADQVVAFPCYSEPSELVDLLNLLAPWGDHSRAAASSAVQIPQPSAPSVRFGPSPAGQTWLGALVAQTELAPGETRTVRLTTSWWFGNRMLDFVQFGPDRPELGATRFWLGNHYSRVWPDALSVTDHVLATWEEQWASARSWTDVLTAVDLPRPWLEHLAAQPIALRTPTTFRTHDGACYGFEGVLGPSTRMWSGDVGGSCPLNCTHVWNYAMAASALFPDFEASMRQTEWDVMLAPSGALPHRVYLPTYLEQLGDGPIGGPVEPALDGMCGAVLKTYRELRRGALGLDWVKTRWERICRLMDHIADTWDPDNTGLLRGIQPSTHDIGLHGANPFMGTYWLAALRAAEELALLLGDEGRAQRWRERFERSSVALDERCFVDGYYIQVPDEDMGLEHQFGRGCLADQLIGQWWAHHLDLGHLLPVEHIRETLRSIVAHNLRDDATTDEMRPFAVEGERGLVMCTWPHGGRPEVPTMYCDEVWTGSEYQVAAHCLFEGLDEEAHSILEALWDRHDGRRRNPFNEVECGDHYVRAMSGWSVLEAALGLQWNHLEGALVVARPGKVPVLTGTGWGQAEIGPDHVRLRCHRGELPVRTVELADQRYRLDNGAVTPVDGWVTLERSRDDG